MDLTEGQHHIALDGERLAKARKTVEAYRPPSRVADLMLLSPCSLGLDEYKLVLAFFRGHDKILRAAEALCFDWQLLEEWEDLLQDTFVYLQDNPPEGPITGRYIYGKLKYLVMSRKRDAHVGMMQEFNSDEHEMPFSEEQTSLFNLYWPFFLMGVRIRTQERKRDWSKWWLTYILGCESVSPEGCVIVLTLDHAEQSSNEGQYSLSGLVEWKELRAAQVAKLKNLVATTIKGGSQFLEYAALRLDSFTTAEVAEIMDEPQGTIKERRMRMVGEIIQPLAKEWIEPQDLRR